MNKVVIAKMKSRVLLHRMSNLFWYSLVRRVRSHRLFIHLQFTNIIMSYKILHFCNIYIPKQWPSPKHCSVSVIQCYCGVSTMHGQMNHIYIPKHLNVNRKFSQSPSITIMTTLQVNLSTHHSYPTFTLNMSLHYEFLGLTMPWRYSCPNHKLYKHGVCSYL